MLFVDDAERYEDSFFYTTTVHVSVACPFGRFPALKSSIRIAEETARCTAKSPPDRGHGGTTS